MDIGACPQNITAHRSDAYFEAHYRSVNVKLMHRSLFVKSHYPVAFIETHKPGRHTLSRWSAISLGRGLSPMNTAMADFFQ
jgi:hypothetical protein